MQNSSVSRIDQTTFIVIDFETVTPKGVPPEPIEVAMMCIVPKLQIDTQASYERFIKPPAHAPVTAFDTGQTGIRAKDLVAAPSVTEVMNEMESWCKRGNPIFIAQNAKYEAAIVKRFSADCPTLSRRPFLDTVAIAKLVLPGLVNYKLDTLAQQYAIPLPWNRHRAMPDVIITANVFLRLVAAGMRQMNWNLVTDLLHIADVNTHTPADENRGSQMSLF